MNKKNLLHLMAIMMVAMLSLGFASCSSDDDDDDNGNPLIGTWVENHTSDDYSYSTFTFKSDGTGAEKVTVIQTKNTREYPFSYSYNSKDYLLSLTYNDGDKMRCNVSVTGKTLILNFDDDIISLTKQ